MRFDFEVRSYLDLSYNDEIQVPVFVCLVQLLLVDPNPDFGSQRLIVWSEVSSVLLLQG